MSNYLPRFAILTIVIYFILFASCKKIVPDETLPMYLTISKVSTLTNYAAQGTDSQKITAIQLFSNSVNIGTFSLPAKIPWLGWGSNLLQIFGAINENGINATKTFYPFFQPDSVYVNFDPSKPLTLKPKMRYVKETVFALNEDFESGNTFEKYSGDKTLRRVVDKSQAYQGSAFGALYFNSKVTTCDIQNQNAFEHVPLTGGPFFVELNYKCNMPFTVGIESIQGTGTPQFSYPVTVNPKGTWNKIYINLTFDVQQAQADFYYLHITATKPDTLTNGYIYFDNIKVLHQ